MIYYNTKDTREGSFMTKTAILYSRVSTSKQERSGLGREAQIANMESFCEREGFTVLETFIDDAVSGSIHPSHRPAMREALAMAKSTGASIIVAKLDRISRSVQHVAELINQGVPFIVCSHPEADAFMLQLLSVFAEKEREQIGQRIKAMWAAKRARGEQVGNPNIKQYTEKAVVALRAKGDASALAFGEQAVEAKNYLAFKQGGSFKGITQAMICDELNRRGFLTPKGAQWTQPAYARMWKRYKSLI